MTLVRSSFFQFIGSAGIADRRQPFKVATDRGETPCELRIAAAQRGISVNTEVAREIDRHEQDVAKLVLDACWPFTCRLLQLGDFLGQLVPEFIELTPVEAQLGSVALQTPRFMQRLGIHASSLRPARRSEMARVGQVGVMTDGVWLVSVTYTKIFKHN